MSGETRDGKHGEATLKGTVKELNFAPKGEIDGVLLDVGGETVQVNIPPDRSGGVAAMVGQVVEVTVRPEPKVAEHPKGDHPVHKLIAFKDRHDAGAVDEVAGTVRRLNYAKHGEANGVVLDSGDFIHLKPDGMKKAGLQVGQEVTAKGKETPSRTGTKVIEAEVVNGVKLSPKKSH